MGFWSRYPVWTPEALGKWTAEQFVQLGPTFVKLGQMLSSRPIPPIPVAFYRELRVLQDRVPSVPLRKHPFPPLLADPVAFRSASVAQVHLAYWHDARAVLKIRKEGVTDLLDLDLQLLSQLPFGVEWQRTLENLRNAFVQELDFEREFACLQVAQTVSARTPLTPAPRTPVPYAVAPEGIVMSFVPGTSIYRIPASPETAQAILDSFLTYVRVAGCFHSDPHPGNLAVGDDGAVIWYDLSALLPLPRDFPDLLKQSALPLATGNVGRLYEVLVSYGALEPVPGSRAAFVEFWQLIQDPEASIQHLEAVARRLVFRPVYLTFGRALFNLQGVCMTVDPGFKLEAGLRSHLERTLPELDLFQEAQAVALRLDRALQRIDYVQTLVESQSHGEEQQRRLQLLLLGWTVLSTMYSIFH